MRVMARRWWVASRWLMRNLIRPCVRQVALGAILLTFALVANNVTANDKRIERVDYLIADGDGFPDKLAQWQSFAMGDGLGFVDRAIWLRLEFSSAMPKDENFWLLIRPIHIDHITVYRNSLTPIERVELGDRTRVTKGALASGWTLPLDADDLREGLLIRLESHNLMYPAIAVHSQSALIDQSMIFFAALSVAVAATLLYLLWAGVTLFSAPTPLLAAFIARLCFYLLTLFVHSGLALPFFGPDALVTQDLAHNATALTYITLAQLFDFMLLREIGGRWAQRWFLGVLVITSLLKFAALVLGEVSWSLQINNIAALTTLLLGLGGALLTRVPKISVYQVSSRMVAIYFLLQAIPLAAIMASGLIPLSRAELLEWGFFNFAIFPGAFVTWILFRRQQSISRQRQTLATRSRLLQARSESETARREEMGALLQMLSHEVRTPLATLRMAQHVDQLNPETLERAISAIDHALVQVDRVDEIERGGLQIKRQVIVLDELIDEVSAEVGADLRFLGQPALVRADPQLLRVMVSNLVSNAEKYRPRDQPIEAWVEYRPGVAVLSVRNPLIAGREPDPRLVFEKYHRGTGARGKSGTGLGLYLVGELAKRMDMQVEARVEDGQFTVVLAMPVPGSSEPEEGGDADRVN